MIEISWGQKGLNSFYKKMETIINNLADHTYNGIEKASEDTRKYALNQKRGSKDDSLILKELTKSANEVLSRIYTNFKYATFLEYGTGTKAEMPHIGNTKTFIESGFRYWLLPVEKADREFSPQRIIVIDGKQFYLMFATQPYPFMRPAAFYTEGNSLNITKEEIRKGILNDIR